MPAVRSFGTGHANNYPRITLHSRWRCARLHAVHTTAVAVAHLVQRCFVVPHSAVSATCTVLSFYERTRSRHFRHLCPCASPMPWCRCRVLHVVAPMAGS